MPPSKKEAASAADAPGTGIEKGCKMQSREYAPKARGVAGGCAPFKGSRLLCSLRSGYGNRKRLQNAAFFPVPGAAAELSLITNGIRPVLCDNKRVHYQKIDILMEVFMIILE